MNRCTSHHPFITSASQCVRPEGHAGTHQITQGVALVEWDTEPKNAYESPSGDFYDLCASRGDRDVARWHAAKKILYAGERGVKTKTQDVREAIQSLQRWLEINPEPTEKS